MNCSFGEERNNVLYSKQMVVLLIRKSVDGAYGHCLSVWKPFSAVVVRWRNAAGASLRYLLAELEVS